MFNVNQITSELAKMPDQALQQYAAMHKNDPYTVSLALAESNRRKEIRGAAMAHMSGQQQPTVVDQDIAGIAAPAASHMLPEEQGIGQLPVKGMERMADGGIVGYADGGETQLPEWLQKLPQDAWARSMYEAVMNKKPGIGLLQPQPQAYPTAATVPAAATPTPVGTDYRAQLNAAEQKMAAPAAATPPQNAPGAGAGITGLPSSQGAPAAPAGAAAPGGYEKAFMDLFKGDTSKEDRMKEITDINAPVIEKMQSLVNEQKNKLKTEGEQDFYMALIQGGLAAAAGNSPNALQNIAQGFEKGAGRYADSLKDLRKAAQENEKMQLSLAEYEASGKKDALKSYYDHQDKMQGYKAQGLASIMHGEISAAATLGSSAMHVKASENMANAYRGPALAEQIRTHLSKELDADPRFKYNAVAKSAELERRLGLELQKYPVMGQYVPTPAGGGGAAGLRYNPQTGKIE